VRMIAATNRRLEEEVKAGSFRSDLLYRLKVVPIRVPPLRERRDDIRPLAEHFLKTHARKLGMPVPELTPESIEALIAHDFPGNVRDLENTLVRAMVLSEPGDVIGLADLPGIDVSSASSNGTVAGRPDEAAPIAESSGGLHDSVARYEREQIERALEAAGGNRARAARALGISRRWLLKKLERYGVSAEGFDPEE